MQTKTVIWLKLKKYSDSPVTDILKMSAKKFAATITL